MVCIYFLFLKAQRQLPLVLVVLLSVSSCHQSINTTVPQYVHFVVVYIGAYTVSFVSQTAVLLSIPVLVCVRARIVVWCT